MLKIKLSRLGKKHEPHYRIVVMEQRSKLTGDTVDTIGHYHPLNKELTVNRPALDKWLALGAQPTGSLRRILKLK